VWRCSHDNPYIKQLYAEFLGAPLGEKSQQQKSQQLLHTSYHHRPEYKR